MSEKYLQDVLDSQKLADDSVEMKDLRRHRDDVEKLLRKKFSGNDLTIKYGGSKAKGTMNKESYDLDLISYFVHGDNTAGSTLKEIHENVESALADDYFIVRRTSALRLYSREPENRVDFHIDVVPGRYVDDKREDVFLHCTKGDKERLKTNLDVHINHIRNSGVTEAIRLLKLWRVRDHLAVRTFILELLAVKLLKQKKTAALTDQMKHVWTKLRDEVSDITIEDPANPNGNDLSELFDETIRQALSTAAANTLRTIENEGWEKVFGTVSRTTSTPAILSGFTVRPRGAFGA